MIDSLLRRKQANDLEHPYPIHTELARKHGDPLSDLEFVHFHGGSALQSPILSDGKHGSLQPSAQYGATKRPQSVGRPSRDCARRVDLCPERAIPVSRASDPEYNHFRRLSSRRAKDELDRHGSPVLLVVSTISFAWVVHRILQGRTLRRAKMKRVFKVL